VAILVNKRLLVAIVRYQGVFNYSQMVSTYQLIIMGTGILQTLFIFIII
jgi:hypothetical protein